MSLQTAARVLPLLGAVCLFLVLAFTFSPINTFKSEDSTSSTNPPYYFDDPPPPQNILDGCHHVYLDMGTNMWGLKLKTITS